MDLYRAWGAACGFDPRWIDSIQANYGAEGVQSVTSASRHFSTAFITEMVARLGLKYLDQTVQAAIKIKSGCFEPGSEAGRI